MGRYPRCAIDGVRKGAWSSEEDELLTRYVKLHGERKWSSLARKAGLKRGGKSCRLRWLNYLRPGIKRGDFSDDEDELIIKLHRLLGNRLWALIAGRLPGRTDNEVKNHWKTILARKLQGQTSDSGLLNIQFQAEEKNTIQNFPWREPEPIPSEAKKANDNILIHENFGLINFGQSSTPSMQIDQDDITMDIFNTDKFFDGLKFDSLQEIDDARASDLLKNGDKTEPLQHMELKKEDSLLNYENELRELLWGNSQQIN